MEKEKNILNSIPAANNLFKVPEGYFSDFSKNLEDKINSMQAKPKEVSLFKKMSPWIYAAASVLLAGFCVQVYLSKGSAIDQSDTTMAKNNSDITQTNAVIEQYDADAALWSAEVDIDDLFIMDFLTD
jgi:hypothetical protein